MAFTYYMPVVIDHTKVGTGTHTNFPLLVSKTSANLKTVANGGHVTSASGYDIYFYTDTGLTTKMDHKLVSYDATTGAIIAWVRMPAGTLPNSASDTTIYIAYGDSGVTTDASTTSTWDDNFVSVWPIGSTVDYKGNNTLTNSGVTLSQAGKIYQSGDFEESQSDYMYAADSASLDSLTGAFTISVWAKFESHTGNLGGMYCKADGQWTGAANKTIDFGFVGGSFYNVIAKNSSNYMNAVKAYTVSDGTWYHIAGSWDGTTVSSTAMKVFINGTKSTDTGSCTGTPNSIQTNNYTAKIGGSSGYYFDGLMEHMSISKVDRGDGWVLTEYNNQNAPDTFLSLGTEVGGEGPPATAVKDLICGFIPFAR